ncbi:GNAT family N-acetyltransferase [Streptomyces sannanensis]|uniref:GNAT family N-acetyltransferase n=1 Tax=Streptomyces sannanensis TaxID=285536 RepID=A0ABP6S6N7_9ACTN
MTTTLRPTGPLHQEADGSRSRPYEVCVNGRPVGAIEIGTDPGLGRGAGEIRSLRIDENDRRRGRGTVAALAAEEVLRGWGCTQVMVSVPAAATAALRLVTALGYIERNTSMARTLPQTAPELPAATEARPMTEAEFAHWRAAAVDGYAQHWIDRGVPEADARAKSEADHRSSLPDGLATPGSDLWVLVHQGAVIGSVWVAQREMAPGEPAGYVYDVEVAEEHRGHGHGRTLMLLAERLAHAAGMSRLGLNVFAGNTPALRLYESLGYTATGHHFWKPLL